MPKNFFQYYKKYLIPYLDITNRIAVVGLLLASLMSLLSLIYLIGFDVDLQHREMIHRLLDRLPYAFMVLGVLRFFSLNESGGKRIKLRVSIVYGLLFVILLPVLFNNGNSLIWNSIRKFLMNDYYQAIVLTMVSILEISGAIIGIMKRRVNPSKVFVISFLMVILIGMGLLLMPNATYNRLSLIDALFVSTSAVCVTGLSPVDVATTFTPLGLAIICLLMQIGGLGLMTLTSFFAVFFMGNRSFYNQMILSDIFGSNQYGSLFGTLLRIMGFTAIIETIGFVCIWLSIHGKIGMTLTEELGYALFHSVSAFCNAGFSTVSSGLGAPAFMGNNALLLTMSALIMLGSIGFPILENFMKVIVFYLKTLFRWIFSRNSRLRRSPHLWNLNSKIVIISTFGLVLLGTLCFLIFEWSKLSGGVLDHIVQSFFMSVSPRTAGFGFYDMNSYTVPSLIVLVFLMWIGGGSQSTAGGVKVNTFAVSVINLWSVVRERSKVEVLGRELSAGSVNRANATIFMSIFVIGISVFMLVLLEPTINFKELFFEAMAALTTVGMGFGITEQLGTTSRLLVIILMFVGRIGLITLMLGLVKRNDELDVDFPKEDIIIT